MCECDCISKNSFLVETNTSSNCSINYSNLSTYLYTNYSLSKEMHLNILLLKKLRLMTFNHQRHVAKQRAS